MDEGEAIKNLVASLKGELAETRKRLETENAAQR
jgi:hypothetical protein